ncbi:MAG: LptF/LptG family permease [Phycisphaerales bacterium]
MTIIDRHIAARFLGNFVLLFAILFVFAVAIDVIVQLDLYTKVVQTSGKTGFAAWIEFVRAVLDLWGPRIFQFYAYLLGLVSVGAAGFTLAQMIRTRELVALLAAGASLLRVGLVLVACSTGLNVLQLLNQELVLPRLAPYLVRTHDDLLSDRVRQFEVPLTRDGRGQLLRAANLDTTTGEISGLLVIERDAKGGAISRIEAPLARWNAERSAYELPEGRRFVRRNADAGPVPGGVEEVRPVDTFATDLSPTALKIRKYEQYAQMLSLRQVREMREQGGVDQGMLSRLTYIRVGGIAVNLLVLIAALPFFLLREPGNLLRQSILCSAFAVPATLGSFVAMSMEMPGLAPAVSVFLPAAILLPIALGRVASVKT